MSRKKKIAEGTYIGGPIGSISGRLYELGDNIKQKGIILIRRNCGLIRAEILTKIDGIITSVGSEHSHFIIYLGESGKSSVLVKRSDMIKIQTLNGVLVEPYKKNKAHIYEFSLPEDEGTQVGTSSISSEKIDWSKIKKRLGIEK